MKIGLVGNGRIAKRHIEAISELPGVSIAGIAEINPDRRNHDGLEHVAFYPDAKTLLSEQSDLDLVTILTESGNHFSHAMEILNFRIPVLVEKPLAMSHATAQQMISSYSKQGTPLFVVKQNRLNPATASALEYLDEGKLGRMTFANASVLWSRNRDYYLADEWRLKRELDGGVVWNQASHYVDLLVRVLGRIESVFAYGENFLSPAETEDTVFAVLKAESGALGSLQATTTMRPSNFEGSLTVSGELGAFRIGGHALNQIVSSTFDDLVGETQGMSSNGLDVSKVYGQSHAKVYSEVLEDLRGGPESQFRAYKTLHVVSLMEAIERSVMDRREVLLSEVERK